MSWQEAEREITEELRKCISSDHKNLEKSVVNHLIEDKPRLLSLFEYSNLLMKNYLEQDHLEHLCELLSEKPSEKSIGEILFQSKHKEKVFAWIYILLGSRNGLRILGEINASTFESISTQDWAHLKRYLNNYFLQSDLSSSVIQQHAKIIFSKLHTVLIEEFAR